MGKYANIVIDISHEKVDKPFTYLVPEHLQEIIKVGDQVEIPFGRGNNKRKGFVLELPKEVALVPGVNYKQIHSIISGTEITTQFIQLAEWMRKNYGGTMNQALRTVLPVKKPGKEKISRMVVMKLTEDEALGHIEAYEKKHAVARVRLLKALLEAPEMEVSMITQKLNVSASVIQAFEKAGFVEVIQVRQYRNPIKIREEVRSKPVLNRNQQEIVDDFCRDYDKGIRKTYYVHGVTGSGKTEVYMEMIQRVLNDGKQVILLIPEIALTFQTVLRFYKRFGERVSILHSRLSDGERYDQLTRAGKGEIDIMIGPRSALFTPFTNLGLIVIDEEHEPTYKSEQIPKYHARETAIERARLSGAGVVLGSATPSLEAYYKAEKGEYTLYTLTQRFGNSTLPEVEIIDLRQELKKGNRSILSESLKKQMAETLEKEEQMMLFLNRRGVSGFVSCRSCGNVVKCPRCDVSLTQHNNGKLICHYCGYETPMIEKCPECGSKFIGGFKAGTQKVEEYVQSIFPQARILRMDADTTKTKDGHEKILSAFANKEADILIGTQMIVKGHDFPNVTLVGILAADLSLHVSDYRAAERTYQLLTQAAGRAGRADKPGKVIIQTYQPEHYAVTCAAEQGYLTFYEREILYRKMLRYPPVGHMLMIFMTGEKEVQLERLAQSLKEVVEKYAQDRMQSHTYENEQAQTDKMSRIQIIGPTEPAIKRIQDIYRKVLYVKCNEYNELVKVKDVLEQYREQTDYADGTVQFDFDPMNSI